MLETDIDYKAEFDGSDWHIGILDITGGPGMTSTQAGIVMWWLFQGGMKWMLGDVAAAVSDKAFKELEKNG